MGQKFRACFILKFALERGEGENGRECKFQNKAHKILDPRSTLNSVVTKGEAAWSVLVFLDYTYGAPRLTSDTSFTGLWIYIGAILKIVANGIIVIHHICIKVAPFE